MRTIAFGEQTESMAKAKRLYKLVTQGRVGEARQYLSEMEPDTAREPAAVRARAILAEQEGNFAEAASLFDSLVGDRAELSDVEALGTVMLRQERYREALELFRNWREEWPDAPGIWCGIGDSHAALGDRSEATEALRRAVELDPGRGGAWYGLTMLGDYEWMHGHRDRLLEGHDPSRDPRDQYSIEFAAARYLEHRGEYDSAFEWLVRANTLRRRWGTLNIDRKIDAAALVMRDWDSQDWSRAAPGHSSDEPIFIIGMPRSGTSLVEQILASHPDVRGIGEKPYLQQEISRTLQQSREPVSKLDWRDAAQRYLDRVAKLPGEAPRFTDKMMFNFNMVGFILRMFPNARLVHCTRDPLDTCIACFRTSFAFLSLSYTLRELGWFYGYYEGMMDFWKQRFGDAVLDVPYEELVSDPESRVGRLLEGIGLRWSDECMRFHRNPRVVRTASMQQVRHGFYTSAVGRAAVYAKHLEPLAKAIDEARARMRPSAGA